MFYKTLRDSKFPHKTKKLFNSQEKKLFISDLSQVYGDGNQLEFVPLNDKKKYKQCKTLKKSEACEVSPAVCLMYVNSEDKFKPLAIQLKPGEKEYLFTADGSNSWHLAKMYYNNAAHGIYYVGACLMLIRKKLMWWATRDI